MAQAHAKKQLPVEKSILRAYMGVIPRLLNSQGSAVVNVEAYMKLLGRNDSTKVLAGMHSVTVTSSFSEWVEINVTEGVRKLWPPTVEDTDLEVTLLLTTDCQLSRKVPAAFTNPATISLSHARKRKRLTTLQPFLVVHLSDETIKEIVRNESINTLDEGDMEIDIILDENMSNTGTRRKRSAQTPGCHIEDFSVNFHKIEIKYIIAPVSYNARTCTGSCDNDFLSRNGRFGNNHAKIMAGARARFEDSQRTAQFYTEPKGPCCTPTKYSSLTVIERGEREDKTIRYVTYPSMRVEACGCR